MKEIIVLQHINIEDPGYIKDLMIKDNINLTTIELDEGEKFLKIYQNMTQCFVWVVLWILGWKRIILG